jgi:hypothetical protein
MEEWLHLLTKDVVVIIDAMALIVVAIGTAEAFFTGLRAALPAPAHRRFREVLVRYGRWLSPGSPSSSPPTSSELQLRQPGSRSGNSGLLR